ncbi:signal peptidase I [Bacillus solimangrovi]|uniref:Signal peptidase I n=1 Tax=Bacillus solimangrovi TaxID=1305675 RepID=A0A1E5LEB6_9BACI|nr:signal peptidase I [Bacillus solimangrovi]OEH92431.1 signal peptidase I [Bacillus solimangrovi]
MRNGTRRMMLSWLRSLSIALLIAIIVRTFVFSSYVVQGESMLPTLQDGNLLIINKIGYKITDIRRFDVVVFHANQREDYVKRVIGLPGDTIAVKDNVLYVNEQPFEQPFFEHTEDIQSSQIFTDDFTLEGLTGERVVPEDALFVMGDNRMNSRDSRFFGFITTEEVVGKVNLRYWPMQQLDVHF